MKRLGLGVALSAGLLVAVSGASAADTGSKPPSPPLVTAYRDVTGQGRLTEGAALVQDVLDKYPDLDGGLVYDQASGALLIQVVSTSDAAQSRRDELVARAEAAQSDVKTSVRFVSFAFRDLKVQLDDLIATRQKWAPKTTLMGGGIDSRRSLIRLYVLTSQVAATEANLDPALRSRVEVVGFVPKAGTGPQ